MMGFEANELQQALFVEVFDATHIGPGRDLVGDHKIVHAWLLSVQPILTDLAGLGRAAVRGGNSDRDIMVFDLMRAMDRLPSDVLSWLDCWTCLRELTSPDALRSLTADECRVRLGALASLDAGL